MRIPSVGRRGGSAKLSELLQEALFAASPTTAISNQETAIAQSESAFANLRINVNIIRGKYM